MIGDALAADPFSGAGGVCAIARFKILLFVAFHYFHLLACSTGIPDDRFSMNPAIGGTEYTGIGSPPSNFS
jgi:hypothetical protein